MYVTISHIFYLTSMTTTYSDLSVDEGTQHIFTGRQMG